MYEDLLLDRHIATSIGRERTRKKEDENAIDLVYHQRVHVYLDSFLAPLLLGVSVLYLARRFILLVGEKVPEMTSYGEDLAWEG